MDGIEKEVEPNEKNITWAIDECMKLLQGLQPGPNADFGTSTTEFNPTVALRLLIHFVGDMHQPLHSVERYSPEHPKGDNGGNSFKIATSGTYSNLHSLWDATVKQYSSSFKAPFSTYYWNKVGKYSDEIRTEFPIKNDLNVDYFGTWPEEAKNISVDFIYKDQVQYVYPDDE